MRTPFPGDTSLVILVSEGASRKIDEWRRTHDVHYRIVPPHITVAYPPFVPEADWLSVRAFLIGLFAEFEPFSMTLSELDSFETFEQDDHILWLKPEDKGMVKRIRDLLVERLPGYVGELPQYYVPHVTVGFFNSAEELSAAKEAIARGLSPLHFRVEDLAYLVIDSDGIAQVRDIIPLGRSIRSTPGAGEGWSAGGGAGFRPR